MPTLDEHQSSQFVKLLYIGNSGSGKTGSLVSLLPDYDLNIIDMDNGLDALRNLAIAQCPDRMKAVSFETVRDKYRATPTGPQVIAPAKAFVRANNLLDKWLDGSKPEEWGPNKILVIDSLTYLGRAAFNWAVSMNPSSKDPRQWYKGAQDAVQGIIDTLTSDVFKTNVIVISHIDYGKDATGIDKGFVSSVGKALGPKLPAAFNTLILASTSGSGKFIKRKIQTMPTALLDLKNPAPLKIDAEFPLETGLADLFRKLKGV